MPWSTCSGSSSFSKCENKFRATIYLQEIGIPRRDVISALLFAFVVIRARIILVVGAELNDSAENIRVDIRQWDDLVGVGFVDAQIFKHRACSNKVRNVQEVKAGGKLALANAVTYGLFRSIWQQKFLSR